MTTTTLSRPIKAAPLMPNEQFGMTLFVITELMFFTALISAYLVIRSQSAMGWVPPYEATLPVASTAVNTLFLLMSGALLLLAGRAFQRSPQKGQRYMGQAVFFGALFLGIQGYEWVQLLSIGMDMGSGIFAACFYLLIGSHALHVAGALLGLIYVYLRARRGVLGANGLQAMQILWSFVVLIWPVLYGLVYFP